MSQQFVTILHLADARVAFFNGSGASGREVPLPQLGDLLADLVVPARQAEVQKAILDQVRATTTRFRR